MGKVLSALAFITILHIGLTAQAEDERYLPKFHHDKKERHHKNAEKVLTFLKVAGVSGGAVKSLAYYVDERVDGGYFMFSNNTYNGINMQFRYDMGGFDKENIELNFRPEGQLYELNINPERAVVRYRLQF